MSAATEKKPNAKVLERGDTTFYQFDSKMGFWGVPNMERQVGFEQRRNVMVTVRHNEHGNRDHAFTPNTSVRPIMCLGGSHTWGGGVEQDLRYTDRLQERLGRRVLNLGHCSLGLDQVCLALMEGADYYKPSVVVVEQYPWAVHRILNSYVIGYVRPHFVLDAKGELKLNKVPPLARYAPFRRLIGAYYAYRKELTEFKGGIDLKDGYDPQNDPIFLYWKTGHYDHMYKLLEKILVVMRDFCRQKGIKLLFAVGAIQQQFGPKSKSALVDYELPRHRLEALLDRNRIPYVDMTERMLREHTPEDPVIFTEGHINAKGHDVFAQGVESELKRLGWVPA